MSVSDGFTKSLLRFNGNWSDVAGKSWSAFGSAAIDSINRKYGTGCGSFPGSASYVTTADHDDFYLGTENFCVDQWVWFNSTSGQQVIWSITNATNNQRICFDLSAGNFRFQCVTSGETVQLSIERTAGTINLNTWYHVALNRHGNIWRIFKDGIQCGTNHTQSFTVYNLDAGPRIGHMRAWDVSGNIKVDVWRWSKGTPRWISNFVPPGGEYLRAGLISFTW